MLRATDGAARRGSLALAHGVVETPAFMPVGTAATVKALAPDDLRAIDARIILANTYHLWLRPGRETIEELGGLHAFMSWDRNILTDSGGFQVFSLESRRVLSGYGLSRHGHDDLFQQLGGESHGQPRGSRNSRQLDGRVGDCDVRHQKLEPVVRELSAAVRLHGGL